MQVVVDELGLNYWKTKNGVFMMNTVCFHLLRNINEKRGKYV